MSTPVFSGKLDSLPATLELLRGYDPAAMAGSIASGAGGHTIAIGSGGSAISAEYLARCRDTLGFGPTTVQTPMQVVVEQSDLIQSNVWLFSAGGDNSDAVAASQAAIDRKARSLTLVTRAPDGAATKLVKQSGGTVHLVPVADPKDGYLATHSLLATMVAILLACDVVSRDPHGLSHLLDQLAVRLTNMRDVRIQASRRADFTTVRFGDTIVAATDPLLRPTSVLLDTSLWEASLCHVQSTDLRNLAHGRHAWLHHRGGDTFVLALTGDDTRGTWTSIEGRLPPALRRMEIGYGTCGRLDNVFAIIDGLGIIEAIGSAVCVDPGKPGIGEFGRLIYEDRSLTALADALPPRVRHKRTAMAIADNRDHAGDPLHMIGRDRLEALAGADIGGVVFDYDGTIVTTAGRWSVPDTEIVDELVRLHGAGLRMGFATGRGGSAGEALRKILPADILPSILIGYYNGGHLRTADVNIDQDPAVADAGISETAAWLEGRADLFAASRFNYREVQITVDMDTLLHPYRFAADLQDCKPFASGRVRILASGHSYDIIPRVSSKLVVVEAVRSSLPVGCEVLCFGDSGSRFGNDYALLSHPFGISVGDVCGAATGCWSLFGAHPTGPEALLRILRALLPSDTGRFRLDISSLGLNS